tara:strand:- start:7669 stop:7944 length:276 start_codon:yes stop_codon:yes gene_type:complete
MLEKQDTRYLVFGWPSEEPRGGMRDLLGVVEDLQKPWELARLRDISDIMNNDDWEWTVDFVEVYDIDSLKPVGAWWVDPNGTWREFDGTYG